MQANSRCGPQFTMVHIMQTSLVAQPYKCGQILVRALGGAPKNPMFLPYTTDYRKTTFLHCLLSGFGWVLMSTATT